MSDELSIALCLLHVHKQCVVIIKVRYQKPFCQWLLLRMGTEKVSWIVDGVYYRGALYSFP